MGDRIDLPGGYVLESAPDPSTASELADDIVGFWAARSSRAAEALRPRLATVLHVLRDGKGVIAGVATSAIIRSRRFGNSVFYEYALQLGPEVRDASVGRRAAAEALTELGRRAERIAHSPPIGMLLVVDQDVMRVKADACVWEAELIYAGSNEKGEHLRVGYFAGARIGVSAT